jgi:hypothetical protein
MANECLALTTEECDFLGLNVNVDDIAIGTDVTEIVSVTPVMPVTPVFMSVDVVGYQRRRRKWCGLRMRRNRWGEFNKV